MKIFLNEQESCNKWRDNHKLEKGAKQGDPVSVYLFILGLEILFKFIKNSKNIKGIKIF